MIDTLPRRLNIKGKWADGYFYLPSENNIDRILEYRLVDLEGTPIQEKELKNVHFCRVSESLFGEDDFSKFKKRPKDSRTFKLGVPFVCTRTNLIDFLGIKEYTLWGNSVDVSFNVDVNTNLDIKEKLTKSQIEKWNTQVEKSKKKTEALQKLASLQKEIAAKQIEADKIRSEIFVEMGEIN